MSDIKVTANIGRDHYRVVLQAGRNTIIADEPTSNGGGDEGMNPHEILASALGACTCATLRMYADHKGMALEAVSVNLSLIRDTENNVTNITRDISFTGPLSPEEKERLLVIANKCPVHKTLTNPINIETKMIS